MTRVGIFAATRWECQAVRRAIHVERWLTVAGRRSVLGSRDGATVMLVRTGVGPVNAREVSRQFFLQHHVDVAVSSGLACALVHAQIGDLLIGTDVLAVSEDTSPAGIACAKVLTEGAYRSAQAAHLPVHAGRVVSVGRIFGSAEDKRRVAEQTGAIALDMESAGIGASAAERGIPFVVLRSASDLVDEDLPLDFNLFLHPHSWSEALWVSAARPRRVLELVRLRRQMVVACDRLTALWVRWLDDGIEERLATAVKSRQGHG